MGKEKEFGIGQAYHNVGSLLYQWMWVWAHCVHRGAAIRCGSESTGRSDRRSGRVRCDASDPRGSIRGFGDWYLYRRRSGIRCIYRCRCRTTRHLRCHGPKNRLSDLDTPTDRGRNRAMWRQHCRTAC